MKIIEGKKLFHNDMPLALSIGKFDGVHLGHRKILSALAARESEGLTPAVLTFDPSPEAWFTGQERVLTTREEKRYLLAQAGVGLLIELPFDRETADMDPAAFAENVLARQLSVRFIAAGPDLSFGAGGRGSFELLESMAGSLAFETQRVDKVQWDGAPISSTRIRGLVEEARMEEAAEMMGRAYLIRGHVEHGRQLGRTIGIPTANLIPPAEKILPPNGVYYSIVTLDGVTYDAMTNIGVKPTVSDEAKVTAETYLYGFDGDLYGQEASVSLLSFRRPERKFADVAELKEAMHLDVEEGIRFHERRRRQEERAV